jgi:6-pyruvoyltetrahydropterin/6-carboxytetrahydropterin synthase
MRYHLEFKDHFDAAHYLRGYRGPCVNLHGHRWEVQVGISGRELDSVGILIDFKAVKRLLAENLPDHRCLNELDYFSGDKNPTAENLAVYLFDRIRSGLRGINASLDLDFVKVWETPDASVRVERGLDD